MAGRQDRDDGRRWGVTRRVLAYYLITGATLAVARVALLVCVNHRFSSDTVNETFDHLLWGLYPEALLVTRTSLGAMSVTLTEVLLVGGALLTVGSFILAMPMPLLGWLAQRRRGT